MSFKEPFDWYEKEGYLLSRKNGSLTLYSYMPRTVLEGNWNFHTRMARGLVLDQDGKIVARPFQKFFNVNERPETRLDSLPYDEPEIAEKMDGSLLIAFLNPETQEWQAVTMKSWDNLQTRYANAWLKTCGSSLDPAYTHLFELVAPWNRVVVAYQNEEMVLIGIVEPGSGYEWPYAKVATYASERGLKAVSFDVGPVSRLDLGDPRIVNREGFVARFGNGLRVKLKYQKYLDLHRIMTNFSFRNIWEKMIESGSCERPEGIDAEFARWFDDKLCALQDQYRAIENDAKAIFRSLPVFKTRKEAASYVMRYTSLQRALLFAMMDGQSYSKIIWKNVKPPGHETFFTKNGT